MLGTTVVSASRRPAHTSARVTARSLMFGTGELRVRLRAYERNRESGQAHRMICRDHGRSAMPSPAGRPDGTTAGEVRRRGAIHARRSDTGGSQGGPDAAQRLTPRTALG